MSDDHEEVRVVTKSGYGSWPTIDLDPCEQVLRTDLWIDGAGHYLRLTVRRPSATSSRRRNAATSRHSGSNGEQS